MATIAASSSTVGFTATAGAEENSTPDATITRELEEKYASASKSRFAIEKHASETVQELFKHGFLESPSVDQFKISARLERNSDSGKIVAEGRKVTEHKTDNGDRTGHIILGAVSDDYEIELHVLPEAEKNYAFVDSKTADQRYIIDSEKEYLIEASADEPDCYRSSDCGDRCKILSGGHNEPPTSVYTYRIYDCHYDPYMERCECWVSDTECDKFNCSCTGYHCPG